MKNLLRISALVFAISAFGGSVKADDVPAWMTQAAAGSIPTYDKKVPIVVLLDESQVRLENEGKLVTTRNFVMRVLTRDGRKQAFARVFYLVSSGKVRDLNAWLIRPDGTKKTYDKKSVIEMNGDPDDVYNEGRVKVLDATGDVDAGYTFGYSITSEDNPLFYQDGFSFQGRFPTLVSRYELSLPVGWTAHSLTFNAPAIEPRKIGNTYTWEARDLPPLAEEPMSPSAANLVPRIVVNYQPDRAKADHKAFASWSDVSKWATAMHDPQVVIDDNVAGKARELTAGLATELDRINAIGTYVQNLQYISIDIGVGHGNGYKPRASNLVLERGYGDCKDKANLMRAMLKVLKVEAYPVAIYSGDSTFVREQWVSPQQFNHLIIAVKVSADVKAKTVIDHPTLGRLLIFDATDQFTPVGDLPDYLQGSYALVIAGEQGTLSKMPTVGTDHDRVVRTILATLQEDGSIKGNIVEQAFGQSSAKFRREERSLSKIAYQNAIEGWLTKGATGAKIDKLTTDDKPTNLLFNMDLNFSAPNYGQTMQGKLLVFKPVLVSRRAELELVDPKRFTPISLDGSNLLETSTFNIPGGFTVDEIPDQVAVEAPFGSYKTRYEVKGNTLVFTRSLRIERQLLPADKYAAVRDFYSKIRLAEQSPVVLMKK